MDLVFLRNYLYLGDVPPVSMIDADVDLCGNVDVHDFSTIISYIFWTIPPNVCDTMFNCAPGTENGAPDSIKLVLSVEPVIGTNVPVVVECSVFVDADTLSTIQFAWTWDNPNLVMNSAVPTFEFQSMDLGAFFFLDTLVGTTNDSQIALCSGTSINTSTSIMPDAGGWQHLVTYNMTATFWDSASTLTIDTIQHPDYPSTEYFFNRFLGPYYKPVWKGVVGLDGDGIDYTVDNCAAHYNPLQEDSDGDNVGDSCDNCLSTPNSLQEDFDGDGIGDACDNCVVLIGNNCFGSEWEVTSGLLPNELCPIWILTDNATPEDPYIDADSLWIITSESSETMYNSQTEPEIQIEFPLVIESEVLAIGGTSNLPYRSWTEIRIDFGDHYGNVLYVGSNEVFLLQDETTKGESSAITPLGVAHEYRIVSFGIDSILVYMDNALVLSGAAFLDSTFWSQSQGITWGNSSTDAWGFSAWVDFRHNAYAFDDDFDGDGLTDSCDNCPTFYNPSQDDLDLDGIGNPCDTFVDLNFSQQAVDSADLFEMVVADLYRDNLNYAIYSGTPTNSGLYVSQVSAQKKFSITTGCLHIYNAAIAVDFINDDTLPDIVAATVDTIYILLNAGQGTLCTSWPITKIEYPGIHPDLPSVKTGYFNNDKFTDLLAGPNYVFYGDGTGDFNSNSTIPKTINAGAVADFNSDGFKDILGVDFDSVYILLNDSSGSFNVFSSIPVDSGSNTVPMNYVVADLDNDCFNDFIITTPDIDSTHNSVLVFGYSDGSGGIAQTDTAIINGIVQNIVVSDMDRDGILDVLAGNGTMKQVEIFRGNGDRTFDDPESFSTEAAGATPYFLSHSDFDRDGQPDFLTGSLDSGNIVVSTVDLMNLPIRSEEMAVTAYTNASMRMINPYGYEISQNYQTIAGASIWRVDVDGDGFLDEQILDYNQIEGWYEFTFYLRPEYNDSSDQFLKVGIRINGSQQLVLIDERPFTKFNGRAGVCPTDSVNFSYYVGWDSTLFYPPSGAVSETNNPDFYWGGLFGPNKTFQRYHLEISETIDFTDIVYSDSFIVSTSKRLCQALNNNSWHFWRVRASDGTSWTEFQGPIALLTGDPCCDDTRGDVNFDASVSPDILDLNYLVNYIFRLGACATCLEEADVNGDGNVNILDLNNLVNYIFRFGPHPGACP